MVLIPPDPDKKAPPRWMTAWPAKVIISLIASVGMGLSALIVAFLIPLYCMFDTGRAGDGTMRPGCPLLIWVAFWVVLGLGLAAIVWTNRRIWRKRKAP